MVLLRRVVRGMQIETKTFIILNTELINMPLLD